MQHSVVGVGKVTKHWDIVPGLLEMFREVSGGSRELMEVSGGLWKSPRCGNRSQAKLEGPQGHRSAKKDFPCGTGGNTMVPRVSP